MIRNANAFIFGGIAMALVTVFLTEQNYCGGGFEGLWQGDWIVGTSIQSRWPLALASITLCWGLFQRTQKQGSN